MIKGNGKERGIYMDVLEAQEEYMRALKLGQKEQRLLLLQGKEPHPAILEEILADMPTLSTVRMGNVEIPVERIVGVKTAGRITAFTAGFLPLMDKDSEFAHKWMHLYSANMSSVGIQEPVVCFEYLGNFYIQEGNKRVSVLKYCGAPRISGVVHRVIPQKTEEPEIQAYYEFMDFYKDTGMYDIRFRRPGDYGKLLAYLGKEPGEVWTEREKRSLRTGFYYFREAFSALSADHLDLLPEEALLLWLRVYPFRDLEEQSAFEIRKALAGLWENMVSISQETPVQVDTEADTELGGSLLSVLLPTSRLQVAFVYQMHPDTSTWAKGHAVGAQYLQKKLGDRVDVRHYYNADTPEQAEQLIEQAVQEGAQMVFTTTPKLSRATLKVAVKYPKIRFLNCSVDAPYSSVRTYYSRVYEGKFITGAIAGAMATNDRIGYIGSYPIFGVPASINAFALGAQMTNPRAKIELRWSCQGGTPVEDLINSGIQVISNRDVPTSSQHRLFGEYGTYIVKEDGLQPLGSPYWLWGNFYVNVVQSVLNGNWGKNKNSRQAVNYWWGMDSGVIDVELAEDLPEGLYQLAQMLRMGLQDGSIDPFHRRIVAQDGRVVNSGDRILSAEELLHMDWLCENVVGSIPPFEEIAPFSQDMVRELGVYRDQIPMEKEEGTL